MTTNNERPFDDLRSTLGEYGRILRHRWRLGFVAMGIVSSIAFWYSQYLPRHYQASTLFERRDDVVLRNLIESRSPYSFDQLKSTMVMDMTGSRAMAETAVTVGLLPADLISPEGALSKDALNALDAALKRHNISASLHLLYASESLDTIKLECTANDPAIAREFVVALRDRYISRTGDRITDILLSTKQFFEGELQRFQQNVTQTNNILRTQFEDFPGVDPTDLASAGRRLEDLRLQRAGVQERITEVKAQIAAREEFLVPLVTQETLNERPPLTGGPATSGTRGNTAVLPVMPQSEEVLTSAIEQVEAEITDATSLRRMTLEHPVVKGLYRKLEGLRTALATLHADRAARVAAAPRLPAGSNGLRAPAPRSPERIRIEVELEALRRQLTALQVNFKKSDDRAQHFAGLYDQLLKNGGELEELCSRLDQDTITIAMWREHLGQLDRILSAESEERGTQFTLVEEPKDSDRALSPRVASVFAVCGGSGLAAAALLVALVELLDRSFRSAGQVTRVLGIPVLECVGVINTPTVRRRRIVSRLIWTPALGLLLGLLLTAGALAYTSLEHPGLHGRAIARLGGVLPGIGSPGPALSDSNGQ